MIMANKECELTGICDILPREELKLENYDIPFYSSLEEMLNASPEFDVLCIATPNGLHEDHAIAGIGTGHHVVIEKPMALTKAGCERIIYDALHHHKQVFCVMQNRYSPPSQWLKEIVSKNILGKIYLVQINCLWNRDERYYSKGNWHGTKNFDGGTLFTQFSHFVDIMYWLFGDIENIQGKFRNFNHQKMIDFEDSGFVNFDIVNGGMGNITFSTSVWDKNMETTLTIIGENGTVKVGGQYMNQVEYCHIKNYTMPELHPSNPPNDYGAYKGSAANHHYIFENVINVLKGKAPITTNAMEGLKVVEIIEKIYANGNRIHEYRQEH